MQDLVEIKATGIRARAMIAAAVFIVIIVAWAAISMQFGILLADTTSPDAPNAVEIARLSARWAPDHARAHNLISAASDDPEISVKEAEQAVSQSPNEYRWRVALGRAYEQVDQIEKAESQFAAATALAPSYALPRWHLGNFYLRQGRDGEAVEQLKKATVDHFSFREQVFALAWDFYKGDPAQVEAMAGETPETRAYLSRFLAQRGKGEDALRVWNQLDDSEKYQLRYIARWTVRDLYGKGSYPEAQELARQILETNAVPESVTNPSFEGPIGDAAQSSFDWQIQPGEPRVVIGADSLEKRTGARSLKVSFRGLVRSEFANIYQTIVVKPDTRYTLRFWVRTEGLRSPVRPILQIVSANDNNALGASPMFEPDSPTWSRVDVSFVSGPSTNAIGIRTLRPVCGEQCSITGVLWYDDFELERTPQ